MTLSSELFQAQKVGQKYTYAYDVQRGKRILKNLAIRIAEESNSISPVSTRQEPDYIAVFDYLSPQKEVINHVIIFMELAHYFISNCKMKPAIWYFAEGDLGTDYFSKIYLKKRYDDHFHNQLTQKNRPFLVKTRINRMLFRDLPSVNFDQIFDKTMDAKKMRVYKKIFCD